MNFEKVNYSYLVWYIVHEMDSIQFGLKSTNHASNIHFKTPKDSDNWKSN